MENVEKNLSFRYYFCRSQRLAGYLMYKGGFKLLSLNPDRDCPQRNVFKFLNCQPLLDHIEEYRQLNKTKE